MQRQKPHIYVFAHSAIDNWKFQYTQGNYMVGKNKTNKQDALT